MLLVLCSVFCVLLTVFFLPCSYLLRSFYRVLIYCVLFTVFLFTAFFLPCSFSVYHLLFTGFYILFTEFSALTSALYVFTFWLEQSPR